MNILAIDYGKKNIGLAWMQDGLDFVLPFGIIDSVGPAVSDLAELLKEEKSDMLVVGLPLGLDGKENPNTRAVREFVGEVRAMVRIPIEFVDERFSSRAADSMGGDATRDEKAAMFILQTYVDKNGFRNG